MGIITVISVSTGVAIFIFGMLLIKYSLEKSYREKLGIYLEKFTANRFSGVLTGALVTAAMQSSSASSVLTAAFVDSGILSLYQAFWIIVGANLGTTLTGLLTALSFTEIAPFFTVIGIVLLTLTKKEKAESRGMFFVGFGLLFVGMDIMEDAAGGISSLPVVSDILTNSSSPLSGILTGCLFTAVIQSSAAVTALLQTLGESGIIGMRQAFYIILGSNIGTCATCLIAAAGLKSGAKKVSLMHVFYNFSGVLLFLIIAEIFPLPEFIDGFTGGGIKTRIAVINIVFNLSSAVIALMLPVKGKNAENKKVFYFNPPYPQSWGRKGVF